MQTHRISGGKMKEILKKYGSLGQAIEELEHLKLALEKHRDMLREQTAMLGLEKANLLTKKKDLQHQIENKSNILQQLSDRVNLRNRQYCVFESLIAMIEGSQSATKSIEDLIHMFQYLLDSGWGERLQPNQLRGIFVDKVLVDLLGCYRCTNCDTRFIISRGVHASFYVLFSLCCPVCHVSSGIKADDSFLQALK